MPAPSDAAILERAKSLCNRSMFTIELQHRRLRTKEPEDKDFIFRFQADLEFLMVALRRLRRSADLAVRVALDDDALRSAISDFDSALPDLVKMRNVSEHFDDYALDKPRSRHRDVRRTQLQVSSWDGTKYEWLDGSLDIDAALAAAEQLFWAVKHASDEYLRTRPA